MKDFFDQIKSFTDILNVGRLIFYPFAGALVVLPLYMVLRIALAVPAETLSMQTKADLKAITTGSSAVWAILFVSSVVVGFLIASMAFSIVVQKRSQALAARDAAPLDPNTSFTYNYPLLRQNKDEDYATWLISEYYRYVEIATYIPLAGIIGLALMELYVFVFLLYDFAGSSSARLSGAHATFLLVLLALNKVRNLWPQVWVPKVVDPCVEAYLTAKRNLIAGVKTVERALSAAPPSANQ